MLTLHPSGARPLYEQITETLQREIADGTLPAGTRLPSSRQLAHDLRVSRITVVTALVFGLTTFYLAWRWT